MKCVVAEFSGFCHGVMQTIKSIEDLLSRNRSVTVSCIGQPVHNPQVTNRLIESGLHVVESLEDITEGILVIRAHGLPPQIVEEAKDKGLQIVDTTCGIVKNVQRLAESLATHGYSVIISGEAKHPEVKSIYGYTGEKGYICSSLTDLEKHEFRGKIGIVSQTTFSKKIFRSMVQRIAELNFSELRVYDTICNSIAQRSISAVAVAKTVDVMLVVGGRMSSNTKRLFEICQEHNPHSYQIETENEIDWGWFHKDMVVGITAGASTPQWVIDQIINYIQKY
jgi:4-hydroxy-3-methylbut-2-enyl diphosphate reductase